MRTRAILFDALGTLLALEPPAPRLCHELAERYAVRITEAEARLAMAAEIAFYRGHLDEGRDPDTLAALREACAAELRRALPEAARHRLPPPGDLVETLLASLRFDAYPDAKPALRACRSAGMRLVVVSNWDVSLHSVLGNVGLSPCLDAILTAAEAGVRKPDPAIFVQALRLADVSAAEALHVGDSLDEDVAGARAAGIEPVLVSRGGLDPPTGLRSVTTLAQLVA
ncbi:MAG: HAD-IA family hydrolase [Candidatus Woesearchaeota archaeon]